MRSIAIGLLCGVLVFVAPAALIVLVLVWLLSGLVQNRQCQVTLIAVEPEYRELPPNVAILDDYR